jgi:putative transposase
MPRMSRTVIPDTPHHITQRGTNRGGVFLTLQDRRVYVELLGEHCRQGAVEILAYCLMPNHVHLVLRPADERGLAIAMRRVHGRYSQYFNARTLRTGHLWQGRFFSCPLEGLHLWNALAYVEQNPVRAGMVGAAEEYAWSSAQEHLSGVDRRKLLAWELWERSGGVAFWRELLGRPVAEGWRRDFLRATYAGNPLGSKEFVETAKTMRTRRKD